MAKIVVWNFLSLSQTDDDDEKQTTATKLMTPTHRPVALWRPSAASVGEWDGGGREGALRGGRVSKGKR